MEIGIPVQITMRKNPDHLQITRTWFEIKYVFLAPLVIAWDMLLFWGYKITFSAPKVDVFVVLFLLLPLVLGIGLTYGLMTGFLNKTVINITPNETSVRHSPFPFWGNKQVASREIYQMFCKKMKMRNGLYWIDIISVQAIMNNQSRITLLSGLKTTEQALFIKQEILKFLNIENTLVKDELDSTGKLFL